MRACFALLLTVVVVSAGKHNGYIQSHLQLYDLDKYIVKSSVAVPDTVVNKYTRLDPADIKAKLQTHVQTAAQNLVDLANTDPQKADAEIVEIPFPISVKHQVGDPNFQQASQAAIQKAADWRAANPNAPGANTGASPSPGTIKKRSMDEVPQMDYEATMELYRQAADFLEKYDVELRFD